MSENNEGKTDGKLIEEKKKFVQAIEKMTTLQRKEIAALAKIYGLGGFFEKFASRISEKKMGELIAMIVLAVLKIRAVRPEFKDSISKTARAYPKLTAGLRQWLLDETITAAVNNTPPAPGNAVQPKTGGQVITPVIAATANNDIKAWTE